MPVWDFSCKKCKHIFEELVSCDNISKVKCPKCNSKTEKMVNTCGVKFGIPQESSKWDNFGYRAGHNYAAAEEERRQAESRSHMGTTPYKEIDDLNNDATWI